MTRKYDAEHLVDEHWSTIAVTPETKTRDLYEPGDNWEIRFTSDAGERVRVELSPRALHELWIEVKDIDNDARRAGHSAACDLCGEMVDFHRAIPTGQGEPAHRHCWAEAFGAPEWFEDY